MGKKSFTPFGKMLKHLQIETGESLTEFAKRAGVGSPLLSQLIHNNRKGINPQVASVAKIMDAFEPSVRFQVFRAIVEEAQKTQSMRGKHNKE